MRESSIQFMKWSSILTILFVGLPITDVLPSLIRVMCYYGIFGLYLFSLLSLKKNMQCLRFTFIFIVLSYLIYIEQWEATGYVSLESKLRSLMLFWMPLLQVVFYSNTNELNIKVIKKCFVVVLTITNTTTAIGLIRFPGAARILAKSALKEGVDKHLYLLNNIGGYGFIYALVFFLPVLVYFYKNTNPKEKSLIMYNIVLAVINIVLSQYATALILLIIELPCILQKKIKVKHYFFIVPLALGAFSFSLPLIKWISGFFNSLNLDKMANRMDNIANYIEFGTVEGDLGTRFKYFSYSIDHLKEHFLLGNIGMKNKAILGLHSELIDLLSGFGLIGTIIVFYFIIKSLKVPYSKYNEGQINLLNIIFLVIIVFMLVDTLFIAHEIAVILILGSYIMFFEQSVEVNNTNIKGGEK